MPELPDLQYIVSKVRPVLRGRMISNVEVREPIVIRMLVSGSFADALTGEQFREIRRHGPFLSFILRSKELVIHPMLTGRFRLLQSSGKKPRNLCFSLFLDDGAVLHYSDQKKMGKVYLTGRNFYAQIPGYLDQGVDITGDEFTLDLFKDLIAQNRRQVRVFLTDQSMLSALGNAYSDEILYEAGIHPKTLCNQLRPEEVERLYRSIKKVISWAIEEVEKRGEPIEVKVRDHLRVRNRKGEPCPRCGTTIRRTQVYGYDTFFCPQCQPASRKQLIPW
jgi:formamidopyrimidine-DNA glycosylase